MRVFVNSTTLVSEMAMQMHCRLEHSHCVSTDSQTHPQCKHLPFTHFAQCVMAMAMTTTGPWHATGNDRDMAVRLVQ